MLAAEVSASEYNKVARAAKGDGRSISSFLRMALRDAGVI